MAETRAKSLEELLAESKAQTEAILSLLNKLTQSQSSTGSERRRSESALIIQKVLRGFLVRKSVKKIIAMRREVNEIEKRLLKKEVVELIQSNTEEKLKVKETLENLLFDSVRGFDSRVRDCWTIFLKVTGLQKKFDAIVSGEETVDICNFAPTEENDNSAGIIISKNVENDSAEFVDLKQQLEYLEERRLKDLGKEHSEFISYPISRGMEKTTEKEISDDEDKKEYAAFYKGGEEITSLKDYVTRMKDDQNDIYYTTDGGKKAVETSPFLEKLKKKGYEVLYMDDPFGNYVVQKLVEVCGEEQRTQTLLLMTRRELELARICLDMHGTRSLQKLLEHLTTREQIQERKMDSGNPTILTVSSSEILIRKILNYKSTRKKLHYKPQVAVKSFPAELIMQVAATKEGTYIVGRGLSGDIFLWEGSFGRLLKKWHAYYRVVTCLVFSDDDSLLGSGLEDEWSRVWSLLTIELTALNPGEHVFLAGSRDGKIYVYALNAKSDINSKHGLHNTELNGVVSEKKLSSSSSSLSPPLFFSNHADIGVDCWRIAEDATRGIIDQVQPTVFSDHRRKAAIDYVQRLIRNCVGCEIFAFGSVPLKTYLPDGDIDLTTFGGINVEEALANNVFSVLDSEDKNGAAEFVVKDVKLLHAEVKLVKCLIQNVVVDISFNQLGGLCTLYFLVQVDRLVGKDHLFKRSTVLIKAWCYYESRILGAYHGLISTYALETLVLYIFHFFHSTLNGPLEVLFRFLDYFSKFDWDNFYINFNGPVRISLLPEIFAEFPENSGDDLLLSNDFLANCVETFSVPAKGCEPNMRACPLEHLNIFDPLKENNNLGRSVSKGNFSRIRSALAFSASKLGSFLSQSEENVEDEVGMFFCNTLDRHGSGQRPDVQNCDPSSRWSGLGSPVLLSDVELQKNLMSNETEFAYSGVTMGEHRQRHGCDTDVKTTEDDNSCGTTIKNEILGTFVPVASSTIFSEVNGLRNGTVISQDRLSPDATELDISRLEDPAFSESALQSFPSSVEATSLPFGTGIHAPHLIFSSSKRGAEPTLPVDASTEKEKEKKTAAARNNLPESVSGTRMKR